MYHQIENGIVKDFVKIHQSVDLSQFINDIISTGNQTNSIEDNDMSKVHTTPRWRRRHWRRM